MPYKILSQVPVKVTMHAFDSPVHPCSFALPLRLVTWNLRSNDFYPYFYDRQTAVPLFPVGNQVFSTENQACPIFYEFLPYHVPKRELQRRPQQETCQKCGTEILANQQNSIEPAQNEKSAKVGVKGKRFKARWDNDYLLKMSKKSPKFLLFHFLSYICSNNSPLKIQHIG